MKINYLTEQDWPTDDISDWSDEDWERWNNRNNHEDDIIDDYDYDEPEETIEFKISVGRSSNPNYLIFNTIITSYLIAKHFKSHTKSHDARLGEPNKAFLGENIYTGNQTLCVRTANPYSKTVTIGDFVRNSGTHGWYATIYNGYIYIIERRVADALLSVKNNFSLSINTFFKAAKTSYGFSYKLSDEDTLYYDNQYNIYKSLPVNSINTHGYLETMQNAYNKNFKLLTGCNLNIKII